MRYLAARKHGALVLCAIITGALLAAPSALAEIRTPKPAPPPDWIANTLASVGVSGQDCTGTSPLLSQPFTAWGDSAQYTLAPGQSAAGFTASGWMLIDGATVIPNVTLADGSTTGSVLDLPSGSLAISPVMCVDPTYPTARTMIRNVSGGGGVAVFVTYAGASGWGKARNGGNAHGHEQKWGLSDRINLEPSHDLGWQLVRFALVPPQDGHGDFQLYNFYVDPYAKR